MMNFPVLRRLALATAAAAGVLLAGCGGGSVVGSIAPSRVVVFGDAFSDAGQAGGAKYTVNDGTVNNWTQEFAARYGITLTAKSSGGTSYAQGNARVTNAIDAAGGSTPSVTAQISNFLASDSPKTADFIVVSGGFSDLIAETVNTGLTDAQRTANVQQAGRDLAAQVVRLINAGAKQIVLSGVYDLGKTPWATATAQNQKLSDLAIAFNSALITSVPVSAPVLYVDAAYYFNLMNNQPVNFGFDSSVVVACTSTASGADGIGISSGAHVSSKVCNTGTIAAGINSGTTSGGVSYLRTLYADSVYTTPQSHRLFGDFAFDRVRTRF